jgi:membrane-bound lytic murein transglycosylase D
VSQADKAYQSGVSNFTAGRLEAARQDLQAALDLLTKTPAELQSDERIKQKREEISAALSKVHSEDEKQVEATAEQPTEPAPIDEANEAPVDEDANTEATAAAEIESTHSDLPLMMNDVVAGYINYFSGRGREALQNGLVRSGRYRDMISETLKSEGVPQDLIYLAQAESGFHSWALSRVGARGMWQFMSSRAKGYGLKRTKWVDERQDPELATRAAARHLKDLYFQFGDWYLAMAAYNSGPGSVQSAVKRTGYADFWELYKRNVLPRETRNYVPIILAVTIMAKNPERYGLGDLQPDAPLTYDRVKIDYPVDLRLAAQCVGVSPDDLQELNPSLLRWTTPEEGEFELHLPAGTRDQYLAAIAAVPKDMRVWWRYHTVREGDSVASIAQAYRSTPEAIAEANHIELEAELASGTHLVVPIDPGQHAASEDQTYARRTTRYRVRRGDTVQRVADNFNVPPAMVRRWNHLRGNSLGGRRVLYLHLPVTPGATATWNAPKSRSKVVRRASASSGPVVRHEVKAGETLYSIANEHKTSVAAIQRDNGKLPIIRPGMVLIIRGK